MNAKKITLLIIVALMAIGLISCQAPEPEVVEKIVEVEKVVEKEVEVQVTVEVEKEVIVEKEVVVEVEKEADGSGGSRGQGGRVTLLYWQAPSNLNSYLSGGTKEQEAASIVIEPLARYDETGSLVPVLATEIPTAENGGISDDLTQITWNIREGILWSDGTPLTAKDVVFTYEYCSNEETGCAHAQNYAGIESVEAVDDTTVTITFEGPKPFPFAPFVAQQGAILQEAQFGDCIGAAAQECTDANFAPIGTGPFVVEEFRPNDAALYSANPNYRDPNKPYFSEVFLKGGGDAAAAARSVLETGEADYAWNLQVEPEILNAMTLAGQGKVVTAFGTNVERLMINQTNPDINLGDDRSEYMDGNNPHPFLTDLNVVNALSLAVDRNILVQTGYGAAGRATCNVIPAPAAYVSTANDVCLTQDVATANKLLDDGGYIDTDNDGIRETPDGVPMVILYQTSTNSVRQGTQAFIKQMWQAIGVETELRNIDASVFFGGDVASPDTYGKFYSDVEMYTNGASGIDLEPYAGAWTFDNISGEGNNWQGSNVPRWYRAEYDALVDELALTGDPGERAELIKQMNDMLVQKGAMIPLIHRGSVSAHANTLLGVRMNAWDSELWNIADWSRSGQ